MGDLTTRTSVPFLIRMPYALLRALRAESDKRKMPVSGIILESLGHDRMPLGRATLERLTEMGAAEARDRRQRIAREITVERQRRREASEDDDQER
jgi:hypothetical protein